MGHLSAWVGAPRWKTGLDNLGTQQPCVFIYSVLLPGVTNVTDRAWHYGFYPWFVVAFARRHPEADFDAFRFALRKADCLATLISARHGIVAADGDERLHGHAFPGRLKLVPVARSLSEGGTRRLSTYAKGDEGPDRYFQAPLGGLGQYYLGVLRDLELLTDKPGGGVDYVIETCSPLAEAFGADVSGDAFMAAVDGDEVSAATLDGLASFCPCTLSGGERESTRARLIDIIMARVGRWKETGSERRHSLGLILDFLERADGAKAIGDVKAFLGACYSGALPDGTAWNPIGPLARSRGFWAIYARNEMLSLSWQAIFGAALQAVERQRDIRGIREAATWCVAQADFRAALASFGHAGFADAVNSDAKTMPDLADTSNEAHELGLWRSVLTKGSSAVLPAMRLLVRLAARHGTELSSYGPFGLQPDALTGYPLTLDSFARAAAGSWRGLDAEQWLATLIATVLAVHQRVAIRKLGQSGDDTLMFRVGEDGIIVERVLDAAAESQPRLNQAFQLLRDLGLTRPEGEGRLPRPTKAGIEVLEECRHG